MTEQAIIDTLEFARKSLEIHGRISTSQLVRLHDLLNSHDGELEYWLKGATDFQGKQALTLQVKGIVTLTCQRCLGPMEYPMDFHTRFTVVSDEDELPAPENEGDETEYLVAASNLQVSQLVEEEVLLGLPLAPMHDSRQCTVSSSDVPQKRENPFKVLKGWKQDKN